MKNYLSVQPSHPVLEPLQSHSMQPPQHSQSLSLTILVGEYELQLAIPRRTKVSELNSIVRAYDKLHEMHGPMGCKPCCLASEEGYEVMDYWLLQEGKTLEPLRDGQRLRVLYVDAETDAQPISLMDFEILKCLGKGGSCAVYLVRSRRSCRLFALKQIAKEYISQYKRFQQILRQRKILLQLPDNLFTINCHAAFESDKHLNFVMDYCPGGELFYHIKEGLLSNDDSVKIYFCEILSCIQFLHNNRILYRDLKVQNRVIQPENILVDIDGHLRIADFGLSKMGFKEDEVADSYCGSPQYMAPEMLLQSGYNYSLDLYTLGVILYEFTTGLPPFYSQDQQQLFCNITNGQVQYPPDVHPNLKKLLERMLMKDPQHRIGSMQEIKDSQWFADVNWGVINTRAYTAPIQLDLKKCYIHDEFLKEDVEEINRVYNRANATEPLFEFFKFQKASCEGVLYGRQKQIGPQRNNGSIRQTTEGSNKDSIKGTKKQPSSQPQSFSNPPPHPQFSCLPQQKPFLRSNKKLTNNPNITNTTLVRPASTLPDQPKQVKKKITLMKKLDKENEQSCERNASNTPKSRSLKKLTVISSKNFNSKRQSDCGQDQSASRDGSRSKSKSIRHILSTKKIAALGRDSSSNHNTTDKKNSTLKSAYRIMLS